MDNSPSTRADGDHVVLTSNTFITPQREHTGGRKRPKCVVVWLWRCGTTDTFFRVQGKRTGTMLPLFRRRRSFTFTEVHEHFSYAPTKVKIE